MTLPYSFNCSLDQLNEKFINSSPNIEVKILYCFKDPSLLGSSSQILNPTLLSNGRGRSVGSRSLKRNLSLHEVVENHIKGMKCNRFIETGHNSRTCLDSS